MEVMNMKVIKVLLPIKAVQKFNEKLGGDGYTFYLVTYRRVEGNMDFTKVV